MRMDSEREWSSSGVRSHPRFDTLRSFRMAFLLRCMYCEAEAKLQLEAGKVGVARLDQSITVRSTIVLRPAFDILAHRTDHATRPTNGHKKARLLLLREKRKNNNKDRLRHYTTTQASFHLLSISPDSVRPLYSLGELFDRPR